MTSPETEVAAGSASRGSGVVYAAAAVAMVIALVIAAVGLGLFPSLGAITSSSSSSSSEITSVSANASTGPPVLCSGLTPSQEETNAKVLSSSSLITPSYDEQFFLGFEQNFTSSMSYNVTVRAQNDSFGFGPAYLLNGLTNSGYWYQVGVAWNLPTGEGAAFTQGFRFVYEVWNTSVSSTVYPRSGGTVVSRFAAHDGDVVLLSLEITLAGQVSMNAFDWNTSARGSASYGSFGATQFLGFKNKVSGFPSSLLTEWYHGLPYFCSDKAVVYSSTAALGSAWLRIDEWNLTGVSGSQQFNSSASGQCCVFLTGYEGVGFQDPVALHSVNTNGTAIYANSREFITP